MSKNVLNTAIKVIFILLLALIPAALLTPKTAAVETILRVAVKPGLPPYQFEENGALRGIHIELIEKMARERGYSIEYVMIENPSQYGELLQNGTVDVVLGSVVMPDNSYDEYNEYVQQEISQSSICMIALNDKVSGIDDRELLGGYITAFEKDTIDYAFMYNLGALTYLVTPNQQETFSALRDGRADMAVGVKESMLYQLEQSGLSDNCTVVYNHMAPIQYALMALPAKQQLLTELNLVLQQLRISGEYESILNRWLIPDPSSQSLLEIISQYWYIYAIVGAVFLGLISINFRINRLLKVQVEEKTVELKLANSALESQITQIQYDADLRSQIIETSPTGMVMINTLGEITLLNRSACHMLGCDDPPLGKPVLSMELYSRLLEDKISLILGGERFLGCIYKGDSIANGPSYRYNILPLNEYNGFSGALLIIEDITDQLRTAEVVLEKEKNRVLSQLVAGIAHEIKNPLLSIKTFAQLIKRKHDSAQFQESFAEIVPQEVDRINSLVENLIDYARPHKGKKEIVHVRELLDSCMFLMKGMSVKCPIVTDISIPEELWVTADPNQLKQIFVNVILNALEAMQEKALKYPDGNEKFLLSVKGCETPQGVVISVCDNGVGMTENQAARAVDPFYTTKQTGTGMGLAICCQFAQENGGLISIESKENLYTIITLTFRRS